MIFRYEPPVCINFKRGPQVGIGITCNYGNNGVAACLYGPQHNTPSGCSTGAGNIDCSTGCYNTSNCGWGYGFSQQFSQLCCPGSSPDPVCSEGSFVGYSNYDCTPGTTAGHQCFAGTCPSDCCNTGSSGREETGWTS